MNASRTMKAKIIYLLALFLLSPYLGEAQCAMCRAVLQNGADQGIAAGVNDGILYLMVFPYILIAGIGFAVYRSMRRKKSA